jgi:5-methylcytosine-specific restriction enzyme subunit McrC
MSADRFGRHDADDQFMVAAAKLAFDLALPTESAGSNLLAMPGREEAWVRRLFERAVGGLYAVALNPLGWHVRCGATLQWQISSKTDGVDDILPAMRTDVVLDHVARGDVSSSTPSSPPSLRRGGIGSKACAAATSTRCMPI